MNRFNESIDHGSLLSQKSLTVERSIFGNQWLNIDFDDEMVGDFWCQAILANSNLNLTKSTVITIKERSYYNIMASTCSIHFVRQTRCISIETRSISQNPTAATLTSSSMNVATSTGNTEPTVTSSRTSQVLVLSSCSLLTSKETNSMLTPLSCSQVPQKSTGNHNDLILIAIGIGCGIMILLVTVIAVIIFNIFYRKRCRARIGKSILN